MQSPYEILGVPRDATEPQIKAAFRREASKAHPDRQGGDQARMTAVNEAHAILSDPARRRHYDESGNSGDRPSVDDEAVQLLAQIFTMALEQELVGIVEFARAKTTEIRQSLITKRAQALEKARRLEAKRKKVRRSGEGVNLVHGIIDTQVAALRAGVGEMNRGLKVASAACKLVEAYDEDRPPPAFRGDPFATLIIGAFGSGTTTGTGRWA